MKVIEYSLEKRLVSRFQRSQKNNLRKNVKTLRRANGWSQYELASRIGCAQYLVSRIESRKNFFPSFQMQCKLVLVFGISFNDLFK